MLLNVENSRIFILDFRHRRRGTNYLEQLWLWFDPKRKPKFMIIDFATGATSTFLSVCLWIKLGWITQNTHKTIGLPRVWIVQFACFAHKKRRRREKVEISRHKKRRSKNIVSPFKQSFSIKACASSSSSSSSSSFRVHPHLNCWTAVLQGTHFSGRQTNPKGFYSFFLLHNQSGKVPRNLCSHWLQWGNGLCLNSLRPKTDQKRHRSKAILFHATRRRHLFAISRMQLECNSLKSSKLPWIPSLWVRFVCLIRLEHNEFWREQLTLDWHWRILFVEEQLNDSKVFEIRSSMSKPFGILFYEQFNL